MPYNSEINDIWLEAKKIMNDKMSMDSIELWFGLLEITDFNDSTNTISFSIDSEYRYNVVIKRYIPFLESAISKAYGEKVHVEVKYIGKRPKFDASIYGLTPDSDEEDENDEKNNSPEPIPEKKGSLTVSENVAPFSFEYTFDNFIVGSSNKFAHAACTAVAARPATDYNPLFIYGPSGLGKTHLMYAILNEMRSKKPNLNILYIKSEDFTNELIESLANGKMKEFKNKYRTCDVLLIDDVQFIAGKNSTQEEFFHTFNALYEDRKQIILTSDRPPREIKTLEERLKTRFEWGLIADIQVPDLELRIAIIKKKAEQAGIELPEEVLLFLAENLRSNVRQLEGAIKKIAARSLLSGDEITMELALDCTADLLGSAEPVNVTLDKIYSTVFKKYGVPKEDMFGNRRTKEIANARHVTIYLIRQITAMSLQNIGKIFARDHSTVVSSIDVVTSRRKTDAVFNLEIENIIKEIVGV